MMEFYVYIRVLWNNTIALSLVVVIFYCFKLKYSDAKNRHYAWSVMEKTNKSHKTFLISKQMFLFVYRRSIDVYGLSTA